MLKLSGKGCRMADSQVFSESYKVTSYLVNLRGRAGLYTILNFIQDVGWMHARNADVKLAPGLGWVFTRQKLMMQEWPAWNETVEIKTWLRQPEGPFVHRDYQLFTKNRQIGECTSSFTVMDMNTRKLAEQDWSAYAHLWRRESQLQHKPEKILFQPGAQELARFQVRNSDIDLNRHVNNTKYAQWILDAIPIDILREGQTLAAYEVNFLAESKINDEISVQTVPEQENSDVLTIIQFQGARLADQKPVFTAKLHVV